MPLLKVWWPPLESGLCEALGRLIMKYENGKWRSTFEATEQVFWDKTYCPKPVRCEVVAAKVTHDGQGSEKVQIRIIEDCVDERFGTVHAKKGVVKWVDGNNIRRAA